MSWPLVWPYPWAPEAEEAAGGDVSVALTGAAVTASAGSVANSRTVAASGAAVTASAGTLAATRTVVLSGIVANASSGTVTPSRTVGLSGAAVSGLAGTLVYESSSDITVALSGAAVVVSAGSVVPSASVAVTGSEVSASAGTLLYVGDGDVVVALSGQSVTTYAGTLSVLPNFTSAGVLYIPIRMVSALWSASGVGATTGEVAWLPPARQPMVYTDGRGQMLCDPAWYRFFEYMAEIRLAGKTGPTLTAVVQTVTATQETASAATATVTELQQQTQANAESLYVVREVVKGNSLIGSGQIPQVEL